MPTLTKGKNEGKTGQLYADGGGRITCAALECAGMTAHFSKMKKDLHGARIEELQPQDVDVWEREFGRPPKCELCGMAQSRLVS